MSRDPNDHRSFYQRVQDFTAGSNARQFWNSVRNYREQKRETPVVFSLPRIVQIEVTNRCNLRCIFCSHALEEMEEGSLSDELVEPLLELTRSAQEVILFGYGEPLLAKSFYRFLEECRAARLSFYTNGVLLTKAKAEEVFSHARRPIFSITFSVDGATAATYDSIRGEGNFERVLHNIKDVAAVRGKEPYPRFYAEFVACRRTIEELPDAVRLCKYDPVADRMLARAIREPWRQV